MYGNYETASVQADIATHRSYVNKLNKISNQYKDMVNLSVDMFNESATFNARAKALSFIGEIPASIGLSGRAKQSLNVAMSIVDEATAYINETFSFTRYVPYAIFGQRCDKYGCRPYLRGYEVVPLGIRQETYQSAISYVDIVANRVNNASSWYISISIGSIGNTLFNINADTVLQLLNLTLKVANNIGLIDDDIYDKITMSPLWQIGLSLVATNALSYAMSNLGYSQTPIGYVDNATYAQMMTSDVISVFDTINTLSSVYNLYNSYKKSKDNDIKISSSTSIKEIIKLRDADIYESGRYFKYFAGQELFNIGLAGHDGYVPQSVQIPSWGIFAKPLHTEDMFISQVMNKNRNATMAGGSAFFDTLTEGVLKTKI